MAPFLAAIISFPHSSIILVMHITLSSLQMVVVHAAEAGQKSILICPASCIAKAKRATREQVDKAVK